MKSLNLDWGAVLAALPAWQGLGVPSRQAVLRTFQKQSITDRLLRGTFGLEEERLLAARFVLPVPGGRPGLQLAPAEQPLVRALLALSRLPVFERPPDLRLLELYLQEHLANTECEGFLQAKVYYNQAQAAAALVGTFGWVEGFRRAADPAAWAAAHSPNRNSSKPLDDPKVAETLRALIGELAAAGEPLPFGELANRLPGPSTAGLGKAVQAGLRFALLFGSLRTADLLPVVGVWPPLVKRLAEPIPAAPTPVTPRETFPGGFGLDDLLTVLAACQAQPPRLRQQDLGLFAKAQAELEKALVPWPEWVEPLVGLKPAQRMDWAVQVLLGAKLCQIGNSRQGPTLEATPAGARWLGLPARDRLRELTLRPGKSGKGATPGRSSRLDGLSFVAPDPGFSFPKETEQRYAAFVAAPAGTFLDLEGFLRFRAHRHNPWIEAQTLPPRIYTGYTSLPLSLERQEDAWQERLRAFLTRLLLPLAGAALGVGPDGRACFSITPVGRYLLGKADDFELADRAAAHILVQPNFEIVFLAPSPALEARIAPFAERKGRGVGTLFRITKKSVLAAAAGGLRAAPVLETLAGASAQPLPKNVQREIEAWFGGTRTVEIAPAILLHCPDAETAARVLAAGGKNMAPLTDTIIELTSLAGQAALIRKLRTVGVFVEERAPVWLPSPADLEAWDDELDDDDDDWGDNAFLRPPPAPRRRRR